MPEGSKNAAILIATSWQALQRALSSESKTLICDCTVTILFSGFYVEANLNDIIAKTKMNEQMITFLNNKPYPGMQDKLGWFYNQFVAREKSMKKSQLDMNILHRKLSRRFPGFAKIYRFRNDISHGIIKKNTLSIDGTIKIREQAKKIVDDLFDIIKKAGYQIPRDTTYKQATQ